MKIMLMSLIVLFSCATKTVAVSSSKPIKSKKESIRYVKAPKQFQVKFITTKGEFVAQFERELSPKAVDRVYQLIKTNYYTQIAIYRVSPNYVAQFGIHDNPEANSYWADGVDDEPSIGKNTIGAIAFARSGPMTRTTQLYINLRNNSPRLDELDWGKVKGFPVVGHVLGDGMKVVRQFYDGYGEEPGKEFDKIKKYGNAFLKQKYPKLDYILSARLIEN